VSLAELRDGGRVLPITRWGTPVMHAPTRQVTVFDDRLHELEEWRKGVDQSLARDLNRFEALDEGERVTQRALLALLDHGIDGNNIDQMQEAKKALQSHLINR
jgi:hypothetical protein